jgi:hypothetical protein
MWMETAEGGLAAVVHGPSTVRWTHDGRVVEVEARTDYPFDESISYRIRLPEAGLPISFALRLRVPGWCEAPRLAVNASSEAGRVVEDYLVIEREWSDGDLVELRLPMTPRAIPRARGAAGLALGPLVLAFSPGEIWQRLPGSVAFGDWEVRPRRAWNMALAVHPETVASVARVERPGVGSPPFGLRTGPPPFGLDGVPLKVWLPGRRVPEWRLERGSAAPPPAVSGDATDVDRLMPLVPYGCARLRIAEFPTARPLAGHLAAGDHGDRPP